MRILVFGTFDPRRHPRAQVLADGFAERGDEVLWCNEPLGVATAARVEALRRPWRLPLLGLRVLRAWRRLRRRARGLPHPDAVVVGYLGHLDVHLARRLFRGVPIVLDHLVSLRDTAVDRRAGAGWLRALLGWLDRRALAAADLVAVDTDEHLQALPRVASAKGVVVPVGAPRSWFVEPPAPEGDRLRAVFFGLYTPLQGAPVIGEALGLLAGEPVEVTMIGAGQDHDAARAAAAGNDAVAWRDWVEPEELPAVVASHHVCLGIFDTGPKAARVVPNKVYQGAAAGCAIVTADTPPQRRALGEAAVLVPPGDAEALAEALRALAADPERVASLRKAARALAEERFAPAAVVEPLRQQLAARPPASRSRRLPPLSPNAWLRYDLIRRELARMRDVTSILECGAGQGAMGARLARDREYVGVEPDPISFRVAHARVAETGLGEVHNGDTGVLPSQRVFDLVCAFEVLEHVEDDLGELRRWRARLRPGGRLMLSVPAYQHRFADADRIAGHYRRYDPASITAVLERAGFGDVRVATYGFPLGFVLERVRNLLAARRLRRQAETGITDRTAASGRFYQPAASLGWITQAGTAPFRLLQRPWLGTGVGTGLLVVARRKDP